MSDTPDETELTGDETAEAEAEAEPGTEDALREEEFVPTMPHFPVEVMLKSFSWWIQHYPNGAVELKFAGMTVHLGPEGPQRAAIPPGYSIMFPTEEIWAQFQEHVRITEVPEEGEPAIKPVPASALDSLRDRRSADQAALSRIHRR